MNCLLFRHTSVHLPFCVWQGGQQTNTIGNLPSDSVQNPQLIKMCFIKFYSSYFLYGWYQWKENKLKYSNITNVTVSVLFTEENELFEVISEICVTFKWPPPSWCLCHDTFSKTTFDWLLFVIPPCEFLAGKLVILRHSQNTKIMKKFYQQLKTVINKCIICTNNLTLGDWCAAHFSARENSMTPLFFFVKYSLPVWKIFNSKSTCNELSEL